MEITCPKCGKKIVVNGLGRKSLFMPLEMDCSASGKCFIVGRAAEKLGCSQPYIYKVLKSNGLTRKEIVTKGHKIKEVK